MDVPGLDDVLADEGWPYASSPPVEDGDPGRFHALFGRDSLITSLQVLPARPDMGAATLRALAGLQGRRDDPGTLEQPGRIGHEFRDAPPDSFVQRGWPAGEFRYYGTADATSWFLVLLARLSDPALESELRPAWTAAADWVAARLDEGDGLIWHQEGTIPGALAQLGWRDTRDPKTSQGGGILRPDGTSPDPPFADLDTQAVTVAALRSVAELSGDPSWSARADELVDRIADRFLPDALQLEGGGRRVEGVGSSLGWVLWADAVPPELRDDVARRLCEPGVLTAYGVRTLSSDSPVFDPVAYHRGSVWPFDSWLAWGGLRAAGRAAEAEALRRGVLDAISKLGRFPELYAVTPEDELRPIPLSNRVQAWTVGATWALQHEWDGRESPATR